MRPEPHVAVGGQVYFSPSGTGIDEEGWRPLGTLVSLEMTEKDLDEESQIRWEDTTRNAKLVSNYSVSWTFKVKGQLAYRAYLRMWFGIESPSLIHNGKKRRKS